VKAELLNCIREEQDRSIVKKVGARGACPAAPHARAARLPAAAELQSGPRAHAAWPAAGAWQTSRSVLLSAPSTGRCCCWRCGATGQPPRGGSWAAPRRRSARTLCGSYAGRPRALNSAGARRGQVCDTVAELAAGILEGGDWPELLPFMFQCVQSGQPRLAEAALLVFAQLARYLADTLRQYLGTLHGVRPPGPRSPVRELHGGGRNPVAHVGQPALLLARRVACAAGRAWRAGRRARQWASVGAPCVGLLVSCAWCESGAPAGAGAGDLPAVAQPGRDAGGDARHQRLHPGAPGARRCGAQARCGRARQGAAGGCRCSSTMLRLCGGAAHALSPCTVCNAERACQVAVCDGVEDRQAPAALAVQVHACGHVAPMQPGAAAHRPRP